MELVKILRELSRRRVMVGIVFAVALIAGLLLAFKPGVPPSSRQYDVSLSSADLLVDTNDDAATESVPPDGQTHLEGRSLRLFHRPARGDRLSVVIPSQR